MRLSRREFEELVAEALDSLPGEFRARLHNLEVVVEERPAPEDYQELGMHPGEVLLGVYRGTPLTERSVFGADLMPDRIVLFRRPIERAGRTRRGILQEIQRTLIHEVAHHFGLSDDRLEELGC